MFVRSYATAALVAALALSPAPAAAPMRVRGFGGTSMLIRSFAVIVAQIVFAAFAIFAFSAPATAQFLTFEVAKASVTGSSASGNVQHGFILLSGTAKITGTTAHNNSLDGFAVRDGFVVLTSAEAAGNGASGLHVENGGIWLTVMSDCVFIGSRGASNGVVHQSGSFLSLRNNTVVGYGGNLPSPLGAY